MINLSTAMLSLVCLWTLAVLPFFSVVSASSDTTQQSQTFRTIPLIPHHTQQQRRRLEQGYDAQDDKNVSRRRSLEPQQVGALYQGYGTHYIDLWCGTNPPQRQTVIVDTGSAVTAFPCSGCRNACGKDYHIDIVFDETNSPTFEVLPCDQCMRGRCTVVTGDPKMNNCKIGMSYQEGSSWTAFEARDYCYVGGPHGTPLDITPGGRALQSGTADIDPSNAASHAFPLVFGCQTKLTGLFKTQLADGIMGMDNAHESFWHQMSAAGKMDEQIFTLCFARQPTADRQGTEAGAMTLGGVDQRLHTSTIVYADVNVHNSFFGVQMRAVYLRKGGGGDSATSTDPSLPIKKIDVPTANLNSATTIVDSGTTDTYFTRNVATAFNTAWKELYGSDYNNKPVSLTEEEINAMPTILFQLNGMEELNKGVEGGSDPNSVVGLAGDLDPDHPYDIIWAMPPSHYMEFDKESGKYVPRFYTDEGRGSVLGANVMMGHDIVFDNANGRLGIAESHCDYVDLVKTNGFEWNAKEPYKNADPGKPEKHTETKPESPSSGGSSWDPDDESSETAKAAGSSSTAAPGADGICSSIICRGSIGLALGLVLVIVLAMKSRSNRYQAAVASAVDSELELQAPNGDAEFGTYRDDDSDDEFDDE